jgi:hypothetical protein
MPWEVKKWDRDYDPSSPFVALLLFVQISNWKIPCMSSPRKKLKVNEMEAHTGWLNRL